MRIKSIILFTFIFIGSCNTPNQKKENYIKNLQEKNRLLEQEISNLERDLKNTESVKLTESDNFKNDDYFTIGSTKEKVIEVMGSPTEYEDWGMYLGIILSYGRSSVTIKKGRVTEYNNFDGNLKVKLTN